MIDSDQHLYEPRSMWHDFVDPKMRDDALTLYARFGDVPSLFMLAISVIAFAWRARRAPRVAGDGR